MYPLQYSNEIFPYDTLFTLLVSSQILIEVERGYIGYYGCRYNPRSDSSQGNVGHIR